MDENENVSWAIECLGLGRGFIMLHKSLLKAYGLEKAMFIANLIDKLRYFVENDKDKDGWFYRTFSDQLQDTGLTLYSIKKIKKEFTEEGIIETKWEGLPAKEFYKINFEKLLESLKVAEKIGRSNLNSLSSSNSNALYNNNRYYNNRYINRGVNQTTAISVGKEKTKSKSKFINPTSKDSPIIPTDSKHSQFEQFWEIYPSPNYGKDKKSKCRREWDKICKLPIEDRPKWGEIKDSLKTHQESKQWKSGYIPLPINWLENESWKDNPEDFFDPDKLNTSQSKTETTSSKPVKPLEETLQENFPKQKQSVKEDIYKLKNLLPDHGEAVLGQRYAELVKELQQKQKRPKLTPAPDSDGDFRERIKHEVLVETWDRIPSPMIILERFIDWLEKQDWIEDLHISHLDINGKTFKLFRKKLEKEIDRDIFVGKATGRK